MVKFLALHVIGGMRASLAGIRASQKKKAGMRNRETMRGAMNRASDQEKEAPMVRLRMKKRMPARMLGSGPSGETNEDATYRSVPGTSKRFHLPFSFGTSPRGFGMYQNDQMDVGMLDRQPRGCVQERGC